MRILTLGDSWTHGPSNNDPPDISWPSQMASRYNVEVVKFEYKKFNHHHLDKNGYTALCDYFAGKIGLS